jgi:hypothetical protein
MRSLSRKLSGDLLSIALLILGACATFALVGGFLLDPRGFGSNLLAEIVGIALGVLIAVLGIEVLTTRRRQQRWYAVRERTFQSIHTHIVDVAVDCLMSSPVPTLMADDEEGEYWNAMGSAIDPPTVEAAELVRKLAKFIREHEEEFQDVQDRRGRFSDFPEERLASLKRQDLTSRAFYDEARDEITLLRDVLTPRVLELADDPTLASLLFEIERAERFWRHSLWIIEHEWEYRSMYAWRAAAAVLEAGADVTAHLAQASAEPLSTSGDRVRD